jgi:hypothetical protein
MNRVKDGKHAFKGRRKSLKESVKASSDVSMFQAVTTVSCEQTSKHSNDFRMLSARELAQLVIIVATVPLIKRRWGQGLLPSHGEGSIKCASEATLTAFLFFHVAIISAASGPLTLIG